MYKIKLCSNFMTISQLGESLRSLYIGTQCYMPLFVSLNLPFLFMSINMGKLKDGFSQMWKTKTKFRNSHTYKKRKCCLLDSPINDSISEIMHQRDTEIFKISATSLIYLPSLKSNFITFYIYWNQYLRLVDFEMLKNKFF